MNSIETRNDAPEKQHAKRSNIAWWVFAAIALFYLLTEHRAHFLGALPYLLLLACPLMHLFMHHGHGHHGHDEGDKK
ncbi:hypothetical protein AT959_02220 [Dechloromonas denitrificans]|uniref:DUF2933 domain-containing protein n=1 Tax=Dechloromonas denitrificans TaxID=281362 RepID=A0A133XNK8_9RHOO|nr:DUF2933 domain-containing protein [Dechloromonas denitrificans]KXB32522.1 hypothetical protein AT959_02220 [Dechloromonas denitrificans]